MKKWQKWALALLIFLAINGAGLLALGHYQMEQFVQSEIHAEKGQMLQIPKGTTGKKLATLLEEAKLIENPQLLPLFFKVHPEHAKIKAGTYSLDEVKTLGDLLEHLNHGKEVQLTVQFIEGTTFKEWRKILRKSGHMQFELQDKKDDELYALLELPTDVPTQALEGWFYPDTYHYVPNSSDLDILKRSTRRLQSALQSAWADRDEGLPLKNSYEMLILASIVQRETHLSEEQPKVASVFINRLNKGMKLQTDPTVIYGMGDNYKGNIRKKDLTTPTPYNTYIIDGLPPTPIGMVTENALLAVAHPSKTDFLYFVANGTGGHTFSNTLSQHNQAVRQYVRWYRENIKGK